MGVDSTTLLCSHLSPALAPRKLRAVQTDDRNCILYPEILETAASSAVINYQDLNGSNKSRRTGCRSVGCIRLFALLEWLVNLGPQFAGLADRVGELNIRHARIVTTSHGI